MSVTDTRRGGAASPRCDGRTRQRDRSRHRVTVAGRRARFGAMGFDVAAEAYDRFMGRYSLPAIATGRGLAGVRSGQRVSMSAAARGPDCRAGRARRSASVTAVDPSEPFVAAVERVTRSDRPASARNPAVPGRRVRRGPRPTRRPLHDDRSRVWPRWRGDAVGRSRRGVRLGPRVAGGAARYSGRPRASSTPA